MVIVTQHPIPNPMVTLYMQPPRVVNVIQPTLIVNFSLMLDFEPILNSIYSFL